MDDGLLQKIAEIIDPMAWKAWEVNAEIQTRRKVSEAKAAEILELVGREDDGPTE